MTRFPSNNYQRRHHRNRRNVWMRDQERTNYHAPYPPMNPPQPIIYTTPPLPMNHVPQSWLEHGADRLLPEHDPATKWSGHHNPIRGSELPCSDSDRGTENRVGKHSKLPMVGHVQQPDAHAHQPPHHGNPSNTMEQATKDGLFSPDKPKHEPTPFSRTHAPKPNTQSPISSNGMPSHYTKQSCDDFKPKTSECHSDPSFSSSNGQCSSTSSAIDGRGARRGRIIDSKTSGVWHDKGPKDAGVQGKRRKKVHLTLPTRLEEILDQYTSTSKSSDNLQVRDSDSPYTVCISRDEPRQQGMGDITSNKPTAGTSGDTPNPK
ncbi:hypothetical protein A4A49_14354 [Nicotiana attenuata]|uniref:Uncharacterized protein n=1 Tax=Nicotiana attenuata TaxID=49451 RepID=A0A1J6I8S8_NICAT|nr:hypothetical protein A4A49_14354 [Nicotiana attenuata]